MADKKWNVYVVDDTQENIQVVGNMLKQEGINISIARNGEQALAGIMKRLPDLILLDVTMPGMDGYEVCERLKANEATKEIPVIFLTGRTNTEDILKGFKVGAVDYVLKPFNSAELLSRVHTHLELKDSKDVINKQNEEIKKQNDEITAAFDELTRTQTKLIESQKMASLGELVAGMAHEINTPVGIGIQGTSTVINRTKGFADTVKDNKLSKNALIEYIEFIYNTSTLVLSNLQRTAELVKSFKKVSVDHMVEEKQTVNINSYLKDVLTTLSPKLTNKNINIHLNIDDEIELESYPSAFAQVITNLIVNSLIHGFEESNQGDISITVIKNQNNQVEIKYTDNGKGMTAEVKNKIFDPFFTTNKQKGTGLGMHIIFNIVTQKLKGEISCESEPNKGVTFTILIPLGN